MFVKCLNEEEKSDVVERYTNQDQSQSDIAMAYQLSVRTIRRVLQERGVLPSREKFECTATDKEMLAVVRNLHEIVDPNTLDNALSRPALTHGNALTYLCKLDPVAYDYALRAVEQARALQVKPKEAANG